MKLTLITQYFLPEIGAPQNRLHEMCKGLQGYGADISVITAMPNYPTGKIFPKYKGKFSLTEQEQGLQIYRYWLYASNSRRAIPRIWSMLSFSLSVLFSLPYLQKRHNDCIIVESPPLTLAVSAFILARLTHAKFILNISDLWPLSAYELGAISNTGFIYRALARLERFLYKRADLCLGQSQQIVDYMSAHGARHTYLFRNGVDPDRFANIIANNTDTTAKSNNTIRIVYTGLLGYAQGIINICKNINFKELNTEFHIYGAGGEQTEIETYLNNNPDKGITFHGAVKREMIPQVLAQYDCTLIPLVKNIYGAVPSKIYESMAAGLPIIFSGDGEGAEIIRNYQLGWVSPSLDYKLLADNIRDAVSSPQIRDQIRKNCIECANRQFNRPRQIKSLYDTIMQILS